MNKGHINEIDQLDFWEVLHNTLWLKIKNWEKEWTRTINFQDTKLDVYLGRISVEWNKGEELILAALLGEVLVSDWQPQHISQVLELVHWLDSSSSPRSPIDLDQTRRVVGFCPLRCDSCCRRCRFRVSCWWVLLLPQLFAVSLSIQADLHWHNGSGGGGRCWWWR